MQERLQKIIARAGVASRRKAEEGHTLDRTVSFSPNCYLLQSNSVLCIIKFRVGHDKGDGMRRSLSPIFPAFQQNEGFQGFRNGKLIAFGWYGGKFNHLQWLLPLLPKCHHYCEPFGGSAAVLLNREPSPVETYNDLDGEVVNFFRVLRNQKDELIEAIGLTPFAREEFYFAVSKNGGSVSDLERARRFFVRARQARTGLAQTASRLTDSS